MEEGKPRSSSLPSGWQPTYQAGYLAALEAVHDRYEFGPEPTVEAFDLWLHGRIIEARQGVTGDRPASATKQGDSEGAPSVQRCKDAGERPAPDYPSLPPGSDPPAHAPEIEGLANSIISRIVVGCGLDPDAIPYEEGTDLVEHLIQLFKHQREQAEADVTRLCEQVEKLKGPEGQICAQDGGVCWDRCSSNFCALEAARKQRDEAEAFLATLREQVETLKGYVQHKADCELNTAVPWSEPVMVGGRLAGLRALSVEDRQRWKSLLRCTYGLASLRQTEQG